MTNKERDDLEKLLKDNLSDQMAPVPDFVWDRIEEELFPEKKRRGFFWIFLAGLLILGGAAAAWLIPGPASHHGQKEAKRGTGITVPRTRIRETAGSFHPVHAGQRSGGADTVRHTFASQFPGSRSHGAGNASIGVAGNRLRTSRTGRQAPGELASHQEKGALSLEKQQAPNTRETEEATHDEKEALAVAQEPAEKQDVPEAADTVAETRKDTLVVLAAGTTNEASPGNENRRKRLMLGFYGGMSLYETAILKEYFVSGQLSNRPFTSSGFELGADFTFRATEKLGIYTQVSFNHKAAAFDYDLAITESDYFDHLSQGELLPIENIIDNGIGNCFLAKGVKADFRMDSWLLAAGANYTVFSIKKLDIAADVRFSVNASSALQLNELTILQVAPYARERFNFIKAGAGLSISYRISERFVAGISPMFHWQLNVDYQSFYKGRGKELILPVRLGFCF